MLKKIVLGILALVLLFTLSGVIFNPKVFPFQNGSERWILAAVLMVLLAVTVLLAWSHSEKKGIDKKLIGGTSAVIVAFFLLMGWVFNRGVYTTSFSLPKTPLGSTKFKDVNHENVYIYISDNSNDRLVRVDDMAGTNRVDLGSRGSGKNQFNSPFQMARDQQKRIYIADRLNDRVVRIDDMTGAGWVAYGITGRSRGMQNLDPPQVGKFAEVTGVAIDSKGRIYVASGGYNQIVRMDDMTGTGWTTFGRRSSTMEVGNFDGPKGVSIDAQDRIYVNDHHWRIIRFDDMNGKNWISYGGTKGSGIGQFEDEVGGTAIDQQGRIYIADEHNGRIVRIDDMTGKGWVEFKGLPNDPLTQPHHIAIGPTGKIYFTDTDYPSNRIVRIDDMTGKGWFVYRPGQLWPTPEGFNAPKGIVVVEK